MHHRLFGVRRPSHVGLLLSAHADLALSALAWRLTSWANMDSSCDFSCNIVDHNQRHMMSCNYLDSLSHSYTSVLSVCDHTGRVSCRLLSASHQILHLNFATFGEVRVFSHFMPVEVSVMGFLRNNQVLVDNSAVMKCTWYNLKWVNIEIVCKNALLSAVL